MQRRGTVCCIVCSGDAPRQIEFEMRGQITISAPWALRASPSSHEADNSEVPKHALQPRTLSPPLPSPRKATTSHSEHSGGLQWGHVSVAHRSHSSAPHMEHARISEHSWQKASSQLAHRFGRGRSKRSKAAQRVGTSGSPRASSDSCRSCQLGA